MESLKEFFNAQPKKEREVIYSLDIKQIILEEQQSGFLEKEDVNLVRAAIRQAYSTLNEAGIAMFYAHEICNILYWSGLIKDEFSCRPEAYQMLEFLRIHPSGPMPFEESLMQMVAQQTAAGSITDHSLSETRMGFYATIRHDSEFPTPSETAAIHYVDKVFRETEDLAFLLKDPRTFLHDVVFRFLDNALKADPGDLTRFKKRFLPIFGSLLKKYAASIQVELGITEIQSTADKTYEETLLEKIIEIRTGERQVEAIREEAYECLEINGRIIGWFPRRHY